MYADSHAPEEPLTQSFALCLTLLNPETSSSEPWAFALNLDTY